MEHSAKRIDPLEAGNSRMGKVKLEQEQGEEHEAKVVQFQAHCRGFLVRKNYQRRVQLLNAFCLLQCDCAVYLKLRYWQ